MTDALILKDKRGEILGIATRHGARNIQVFGSLARGQSGPASDLDLLVQLEPGRSLLDIIAIKQDLEDLLGIHVDVVTEEALSPYIRDLVIDEALGL